LLDKRGWDQILESEDDVKVFLEKVLCMPGNYVITAYERCLINSQAKRTKLIVHSYYVITDTCAGEYHTISYYGTNITFNSEGAWTMDAGNDISSYGNYLTGKNNWDVIKIETRNAIDTDKTVKNIIEKMSMGITYHYNNHLKKKPGKDNCNTAVWETIVTL
jgi:uncharacterized membrane protein YvbJ